MLEKIKKEHIIEYNIKENLKKGLVTYANDITVPPEKVLLPEFNPGVIGFNQTNDFNEFIGYVDAIDKDISFLEKAQKFIDDYSYFLKLNNDINKIVLKNKLRKLNKQLDYNSYDDKMYSNVITFHDFMDVNFENNKPYPKTTSFVDLKNYKVLNNRIDGQIKDIENIDIRITSGNFTVDNDDLRRFINGDLFITTPNRYKDKTCNNIEFTINFKKAIRLNRLALDFLYIKNVNCEIKAQTNSKTITILNEDLNKQHYDIIFESEFINSISIKVINNKDESFKLGINNFAIFNDIYEIDSSICTKPLPVNKKAFKIKVNAIEFNSTRCFVLVGLIKGDTITWKDADDNFLYNEPSKRHDIDYIVVQCNLLGDKHNTPVINEIIIENDINNISGFLDEDDFNNDGTNVIPNDTKGSITVNIVKKGANTNKGKLTVNIIKR